MRKAIGWALRQYAWTDPAEVKRYVKANRDRLSPLSAREALKNACEAVEERLSQSRRRRRLRRPTALGIDWSIREAPEFPTLWRHADSGCPTLRNPGPRAARSSCAGPARTTSRTSTSPCPPASWSSSPASAGRGSRRSPSTRSTPRGSAATSSRCRPTRGSSSSGWRSPTSTGSKASARRSPSGRRTASATRARRSARPPRSTTTCACCSRASAGPICRQCGVDVMRETAELVATRLSELPAGTRLLIGFELPVVAMAANGSSGDADLGDDDGEDVERAGGAEAVGARGRPPRRSRRLRRRGFGRVWSTARRWRSTTSSRLRSRAGRRIEVVVDRVKLDGDVRSRLTDSIETSYREGGGAAFAVVARRRRRTGSAHRVLREVRVPHLRHRLRDAAAAPVLVQQPVRRLPDVPRLRQHHRARHGRWWCPTRRSRSTRAPSSRGASRTTARSWPS